MTRREREKIRKKRQRREMALTAVMMAVLILVVTYLFYSMWDVRRSQEQLLIQQEDTLDTLNEMRLEIGERGAGTASAAVFPLTLRERDLVERVVAAESRGQCLLGQKAVAQTIKDRAVLWGKSIEEVLLTPGQYAEPYRGEISSDTACAVRDVFDAGERVFEGPVTHFHSGTAPYWASGKELRGEIEAHRFYY